MLTPCSRSWSHVDITTLTPAQLNKQLDLVSLTLYTVASELTVPSSQVETALKKILGVVPRFFRPVRPSLSLPPSSSDTFASPMANTTLPHLPSSLPEATTPLYGPSTAAILSASLPPNLSRGTRRCTIAIPHQSWPLTMVRPFLILWGITCSHGRTQRSRKELRRPSSPPSFLNSLRVDTSALFPIHPVQEANEEYRLVTVAECLGLSPYQSIGSPSARDATWTCDGAFFARSSPRGKADEVWM